jgi:hemoglobin
LGNSAAHCMAPEMIGRPQSANGHLNTKSSQPSQLAASFVFSTYNVAYCSKADAPAVSIRVRYWGQSCRGSERQVRQLLTHFGHCRVSPCDDFEEVPMATQDSPSLYERLGGVYSIATVIDDFIDRIMIDPRLNANPRVAEAHHRVSPAGFKYLVTEMVCWATGGPQKYTGRSMKDSHQHLMITATEWEAFLADLQQTLDKFAVPKVEQAEIKAIVDSTRADIVV